MGKTKKQLIDELVDGFDYKRRDLLTRTKVELQELYNELHGADILFPNGRDYDTEDEEGI